MSKTKIMRSSTGTIATIMQREQIPGTGAYDTAKSTLSSMDNTYSHVLEYKLY